MKSPVLVVVSGPPGAGKTTLSRFLAGELSIPLLDRDDIKDRIFDALGWSDRSSSHRVGAASWDLMYVFAERVLRGGSPLMLESNFGRRFHDERLRALRLLVPFRLVEVHCRADAPVMAGRFRDRWQSGGRHPGHASGDLWDEGAFLSHLAERDYRPFDLSDAVIEVDTNDPDRIDIAAIVSGIRRSLEGFDGLAGR